MIFYILGIIIVVMFCAIFLYADIDSDRYDDEGDEKNY